jgi:hypothetical protein
VQWAVISKPYFTELSLWFLLSSLANACWILSWHHLFIYASVMIMVMLLFSLTKLFLLIQSADLKSMTEKVFIKLTFIFYLSWICVATIANISALLVSLSWEGGVLSPVMWTIIMITIACVLGIYIAARFREPAFLIVLMWALYGIYSKWNNTDNDVIALSALAGIILLFLLFFFFRYGLKKKAS